MEKINRLIENKINFKNLKKYTAIIGETPSIGARSPKLWNSAYKVFKKKCLMFPFDVYDNNLEKLISELRKDNRFIGGSVTAPYKEKIIKYLDGISQESKKIGSINTLIKKNKKIYGENTDYYGTLYSLKNISNRKKILVLGCGGAGKAVIIACLKKFNKSKFMLHNRNKNKVKNFIKNLEKKNLIKIVNNYNELKNLKNLDLIINTTSIGFDSWVKEKNDFKNLKFFNPISDLKKIKHVKKKISQNFLNRNFRIINKNFNELNKFYAKNNDAVIFDIIYNPLMSQFLKIAKNSNLKTINGLEMNLYQAIKAFSIVNGLKNEKKIRKAMISYG